MTEHPDDLDIDDTEATEDDTEDTGTLAHVPPSQRRDDDKGKDSNALEGGDDSEAADQWYDDPEGAR